VGRTPARMSPRLRGRRRGRRGSRARSSPAWCRSGFGRGRGSRRGRRMCRRRFRGRGLRCRLGRGRRCCGRSRGRLPGRALLGAGLLGRFLCRLFGRFLRGLLGRFTGLLRRLFGFLRGLLRRFLRRFFRRFLGGFLLRRQRFFLLGLALLAFFILFSFSHRDPPVAADQSLSIIFHRALQTSAFRAGPVDQC